MFITFEGPEGGGKSTAIQAISDRFARAGREVLVTREPGAGDFGAAVRNLLLEGGEMDAKAELFLFLADRAEHIAHLVSPALNAGRIVLCDRHADSTLVYQGYGRGLDVELLRDLNRFATGGLTPNLTLLLDVEPAVGLARQTKGDRLDRESMEFHVRVREGFLTEARREPERWRVVDASADPDEVAEACWNAIQKAI